MLLGELAALFVADVAGRRADESRHVVLLHVLGHVEVDQRSSSPNMNSASALESSVLPTPDGPTKMNEPIGRFGSFRPAAGPADRLGDRA
jgi:hypothetical protein